MTYKQIETMRQTRLFITELIVPAALIAYGVDKAHPEYKYRVRDWGKKKVNEAKESAKKIFKR